MTSGEGWLPPSWSQSRIRVPVLFTAPGPRGCVCRLFAAAVHFVWFPFPLLLRPCNNGIFICLCRQTLCPLLHGIVASQITSEAAVANINITCALASGFEFTQDSGTVP